MNPGGVLLLGSAETIGTFTELFSPVDAKTRLFRRLDQSVATVPVEFPPGLRRAESARADARRRAREVASRRPRTFRRLADHADRCSAMRRPPCSCNDKGDILYISGRTGKYLEPAAGKANLNVFAMAREGLRYELSERVRDGAARRATGQCARPEVGTQRRDADRSTSRSQRLSEPKELRGNVMVVFTRRHRRAGRAPAPTKSPRRNETRAWRSWRTSSQRAREEVQTTREEMQTSQEELKSTNEELQSHQRGAAVAPTRS